MFEAPLPMDAPQPADVCLTFLVNAVEAMADAVGRLADAVERMDERFNDQADAIQA